MASPTIYYNIHFWFGAVCDTHRFAHFTLNDYRLPFVIRVSTLRKGSAACDDNPPSTRTVRNYYWVYVFILIWNVRGQPRWAFPASLAAGIRAAAHRLDQAAASAPVPVAPAARKADLDQAPRGAVFPRIVSCVSPGSRPPPSTLTAQSLLDAPWVFVLRYPLFCIGGALLPETCGRQRNIYLPVFVADDVLAAYAVCIFAHWATVLQMVQASGLSDLWKCRAPAP